MKKCNNCGFENPDNAKFCNECGKELNSILKCPQCGAENIYTAKFCNDCGSSLNDEPASKAKYIYKCPECGRYSDIYGYCSICGYYSEKNNPSQKTQKDIPQNVNSSKKCPNCGYSMGDSDICESCGFSKADETKKYLEKLSEENPDLSETLDNIHKDEKASTIRLFFTLGIAAIIIVLTLIIAAKASNVHEENERQSNLKTTTTSSPTASPPRATSTYQSSNTTTSGSSSYDGKITKSTKLPDGYPGFIEIVSYCEVDMPDLIGYDASISLDESYTSIIKTDLRYKLETSRLKLKTDGSYHSAVFILEFSGYTYKSYHYTTVEVDGIKLK